MIIACRECGARFTPPEPPPVVTICGLCERERLAKLRRLRAAAPDLLAALHGAMFFVPVGTEARKRADAAFAKAEE